MLDSIVLYRGVLQARSQDTALSARPREETGGMSEKGHELREQPLTWTWTETWNWAGGGLKQGRLRWEKLGRPRADCDGGEGGAGEGWETVWCSLSQSRGWAGCCCCCCCCWFVCVCVCVCVWTSRYNNAELYAMCDVFGLSGRVVERARQRDKRRKKREARTEDGAEKARTRLILFLASPHCCSVAVSASCVCACVCCGSFWRWSLLQWGTLKSRTSLSSLVVEEAVSMQH